MPEESGWRAAGSLHTRKSLVGFASGFSSASHLLQPAFFPMHFVKLSVLRCHANVLMTVSIDSGVELLGRERETTRTRSRLSLARDHLEKTEFLHFSFCIA
ncbi:hypothetical protein Y032_0169g212 [Ancylostoma ceylanicum]|uniref:Uncharacterized protein n=1 Tax=Ancylostoma ceylanicum TaxID=53326 RepID=A0A016SW58_9BILA|nr:hypothetical protein Y032_0169g212 [Ancylostoma ceylanicum]